MKRPSFQFYPADWQADNSLRACSIAARGLWMEMICIMHQAAPYGYFLLNQNPIQNSTLARMVGCSIEETNALLDELEANAVFVRDEEGTIYSKRMVKDEYIRQIRAKAGKKGGNPNLKKGNKGDVQPQNEGTLLNQNPNQTGKQNPTPSSSSPSSINNHTLPNAKTREDEPASLPEIPELLSHLVNFFTRKGYRKDQVQTGKLVPVFNDWIARKIPFTLIQQACEIAETKNPVIGTPAFYVPFVEELIVTSSQPREKPPRRPSQKQPKNQKFNGFDRINQNRRQPNEQYAGNTFDGEYYPVETGKQ